MKKILPKGMADQGTRVVLNHAPVFGEGGNCPIRAWLPIQPEIINGVFALFKPFENFPLYNLNYFNSFRQNDPSFNTFLVIIQILPFKGKIRFDHDIKIEVQSVDAVMVSLDRELKVHVIAQKFIALVVPTIYR